MCIRFLWSLAFPLFIPSLELFFPCYCFPHDICVYDRPFFSVPLMSGCVTCVFFAVVFITIYFFYSRSNGSKDGSLLLTSCAENTRIFGTVCISAADL
ncbi:hypothetical protein J3A83DRAFT_2974810 [Scleroderma citrinum]